MSVLTIAQVDRYRQLILTAAYQSGEPQHLASSMSIVHILHVLYDHVMDHQCDLFVLSKGHAALALYAVLAARGDIQPDDMVRLGKRGSPLGGHPDRLKVPQVNASTGSLGTGIGMAVGMAWAKKMDGSAGHVFCLVGDGELQEGSCWEALEFAHTMEMRNLTVLIDNNSSHAAVNLKMLPRVALRDLADVLRHKGDGQLPLALAIPTIKGHGVRAMELDPQAWHRRALTADEYDKFMMEVTDVPASATRH